MKYRIKQSMFAAGIAMAITMPLIGAGVASAQVVTITPDEQTIFYQEASNILGIPVVVIQNGYARGESLAQIAYDNGISPAQFDSYLVVLNNSLPAYFSGLVSNGRITRDDYNHILSFWGNEYSRDQNFDRNHGGGQNGNGQNNRNGRMNGQNGRGPGPNGNTGTNGNGRTNGH